MREHFLSYFDSFTLAKGSDYFRRGKVLFQKQRRDGFIEGIVAGSNDRRYSVLLTLTTQTQEIAKSSCTCPVGPRCKHCAALALDYLDDVKTVNVHKTFDVLLPGDAGQKFPDARVLPSASNGASNQSAGPDSLAAYRMSAVKQSYTRVAELLRNAGKLSATKSGAARSSGEPTATVIYLLNDRPDNPVPIVEPRKISLKKDGTFGVEAILKFDRLSDNPPPKYADDRDQKIGKLWTAISVYSTRSSYGSYSVDSEPELFRSLVTNILATGRCYLRTREAQPLRLGDPLEGKLAWETTEKGQRVCVVAVDGTSVHQCLRWRSPWYLNAEEGRCGPVELDIPPAILTSILTAPPITKGDAAAVQMFFTQTGLDRIIPPPPSDKNIEKRLISPIHSLNIEMVKCEFPTQIGAEQLSEPGTSLKVIRVTTELPPLATAPQTIDDDTVVIEEYNPSSPQIAPLLEGMGFREISASSFGKPAHEARYFLPSVAKDWLNFATSHVDELRDSGWDIPDDIEDDLEFVDFDSCDLIFNVESDDSWWFTLSLTLDYDGQKFSLLPLLVSAIHSLPRTHEIDAEAIELLNHNGRFVTVLPNGRFLAIPFDRIRSILGAVAEMVVKEGKPKKIRLSVLDAQALMEANKLTNARWLGAERMTKMIECLRQLSSIKQVQPPKNFNASLRPYQMEGLSWLQVLAKHGFGGVLADDMGLGKTIQLLAHMCLEKEHGRLRKPFLVICPTSVLPNWVSEASKFCPQLKVVAYSGANRSAKWSEVQSADLVLSTYALVIRDLDLLKSVKWHGIALDESQAIKNPTSQISQLVGSLSANHRFCVTGTPIENHLGELWSQFRFLMPGLLGDQGGFNAAFRKPIEQSGNVKQKEKLVKRIRPFTMRRTKNEVAAELPDKTTIIQSIELEGDQRDLYETVRLASTKAVRETIAKNGFRSSQIMILDALLKLRQVCCDPRLVKLAEARKVQTSTKLELLVDKVVELVDEGRKVLVFSQFTSMLDLIAADLEKNNIHFVELRGDTTDRVTPVARFQNGDVPVFLISLKAGGTGLNLTAADTVIHYDPWWNPAVEEQATDRAHRIGQTKNVFVYKLIAQGTIEQRMVELQDRKRNLANSILDETGGHKMNFSEQDLEYLLAPIG